jgi:dihydropteroate synthase
MQYWQTSRRQITLERPLVMGILNVTPDSFSDGGAFASVDTALRRAEEMIVEGADLIDIGGESTRPGSVRIKGDEEIRRAVPIIAAIGKRFDVPISIDTSKSEVARESINAGAEVVNDISGLRWDERIADVAAQSGAGLVLMHSRGTFETMHSQPPVDDILREVTAVLSSSIGIAKDHGVIDPQIVLDIGIGFGKTLDQNLELLANIDRIADEFKGYPILSGTSRKSFIGKILDDAPPSERLGGSLATAIVAVQKGARIIRVHDVKETVSALRVLERIREI